MTTMKKTFTAILALLLTLSVWAKSPLESYAELAFKFNATGSPEIEAGKVDAFLKDAKEYLLDNADKNSTEYILTEAMVKKLKVYQYLFNKIHSSPPATGQADIHNEITYQTLRGAFNSNPKNRDVIIFEKGDSDLDLQINKLSDITELLTPASFFILENPTDINDFPALIKKKTLFLKEMARYSRKQNMIAKWTLDYTFRDKEIDCGDVEEEFVNQCQIAKLLIEKNTALRPTSTYKMTTQINNALAKARRELQKELKPKEEFKLFRDKYDRIGKVTPKNIDENFPKAVERFTSHMAELQTISEIHGLSLLQAHPDLNKEIKWLKSPHLKRKCDITPFLSLRGEINCGYTAFGKYGKDSEKMFSIDLLERILEETYEKIDSEEKRLAEFEEKLNQFYEEKLSKVSERTHPRIRSRRLRRQNSINSDLNNMMTSEIELRPQSYGAALMEMNEFIPMVNSHINEITHKINVNDFNKNLKSAGVITALIASAFITGPVGMAIGLAITFYELVDYSSKEADYKIRAATATIEFIDLQTRGALNKDELNLLSSRIISLEEKVKSYRMYTYFAAAGLISSPIVLGNVISKTTSKLQSMLENIKFFEKFAYSIHNSSSIKQKIFHYMDTLGIQDPSAFISNMMRARKHLMTLDKFSSSILIDDIISHPEKMRLIKSALAGSGELIELIKNPSLTRDILRTMAKIEAVEVNFFTE
ncbi:MAG: hypothetical protein KAG61_13940 [Bacteriovoracaceae bacterium]|nr:hypothetical protein [Bacteriovoracaceae bacterium]